MRRRNLYFGEMEGPEQEMRIGREAASLSRTSVSGRFAYVEGNTELHECNAVLPFIVGEYAGSCVRCRSAT